MLGGSLLGDPKALGLDAMFPAFFAVLLFSEARDRRADHRGRAGRGDRVPLMPFTPAGIPVVAAACAALIGLKQVRRVTA